MGNLTAEEAKDAVIEQLGRPLGENMYWLGNAFTNLHIEWRIFKGLFVHGKERVEVLNLASGLVAMYASKTLFESVLLGLCRITDPAETGRGRGAKKNLTLETLSSQVPEEFRQEYSKLVATAQAETKFARDRRNRVIAHADLFVATNVEEADAATVKNVDDALKCIDLVLNFVNQKLRDSTTLYSDAIIQLDNERTFLRALYLGNRTWKDLLDRQTVAVKKRDMGEIRKIRKEMELPKWIDE
ncbi:MAG: AbiU2 domain-containing protein [Paracoccaceae bacterium]